MMINAQPRQNTHQLDPSPQDAAIIRALSSITPQQAETIAHAVETASGDAAWNVRTTHDYDGYLSILIELSTPNSQCASYFVSGTEHRLDLFEVTDDHLVVIANFGHVEELSMHILNLMAR